MGFATGSFANDEITLYLPTHGITTNWDAEVEPEALTPNSVTFSSSTATVNVDDKVMLTAIVAPTGASQWPVTWTVGGKNAGAVKLYSDADCNHEVGTDVTTVLTVYAKGLTEGEATVTATSDDDPSLSATCTITVKTPAAPAETKCRIMGLVAFGPVYFNKTFEATLPFKATIGEILLMIVEQSPTYDITSATVTSGTNITIGTFNGYDTQVTITDAGDAVVSLPLEGEPFPETLILSVAPIYTVSLAEGTADAGNWTAKAGDATKFSALPQEVDKGTAVTLKYNGRLKVKSVTATTDAVPTYLMGDATKKELVEAEIPDTVTKVTNADGDVTWAAGTYLVEGDVTINGGIELSGDVELIIKDGAKLTANYIFGDYNNLNIYGQANKSGELNVACSDGDAISNLSVLNIHSCKVNASSSSNESGGFYEIDEFNLYGGSVDAKYTSVSSGYGLYDISSLNIWGGEMKAEGKGTTEYSYGISCLNSVTNVTVYGGKLWVKADTNALDPTYKVTFTKDPSYDGKIETSNDGEYWDEYTDEGKPDAKYVRVGY